MKSNPWNSIKLSDYINHMSNKNVLQTQILNTIIKEQLEIISNIQNSSVAILGITDGNGLEHINPLKVCEVVGIDINKEYLCQCKESHEHLSSILNLQCIDLMTEKKKLLSFLKFRFDYSRFNSYIYILIILLKLVAGFLKKQNSVQNNIS